MAKITTTFEFEAITERKNIEELLKFGFRWWDEDKIIMLIPGYCYQFIPKDFTIYSLSGIPRKFIPGKDDNDTRFGCLPYGISLKDGKVKP